MCQAPTDVQETDRPGPAKHQGDRCVPEAGEGVARLEGFSPARHRRDGRRPERTPRAQKLADAEAARHQSDRRRRGRPTEGVATRGDCTLTATLLYKLAPEWSL